MTDDITIRAAGVHDATILATLRYRFRAERVPPVESEAEFVERAAPWIAERLARDDWRAWVAVEKGEVVGHVFVHLIDKVPNPVPEAETLAYLTNFYIAPALRNRGVGARLLDAALAVCGQDEVESVFLRPSKGSVPLYKRHGFTEAALLERSNRDKH